MKIALITFHHARNCGAMLQAWALKRVLERMGHTVGFPACNFVGNRIDWAVRHIPRDKKGLQWVRSCVGRVWIDLNQIIDGIGAARRYGRFAKRFLNEVICRETEIGDLFDCAVIGSDQVWNPDLTGPWTPLFLGETLPEKFPKIAYAASVGDVPLRNSSLGRLSRALRTFRQISVREPLTAKLLEGGERGQAKVVCDPTLLASEAEYFSLCDGDTPTKPYLYMYCMYLSKFEFELAHRLARELNCQLVITPVYLTRENRHTDFVDTKLSPSRMVNLIRNAEYVIGSSFHGTALSLVHRKKFISLRNQVDDFESRPAALLNHIGEGRRIVTPSSNFENVLRLIQMPVADDAFIRLSAFRDESLQFLSGALGGLQNG